jgi:hypothetical protein
VTLDGKPLDDGDIQFNPDGGEGVAVGSMVRDGRYTLPNPPGLIPGKYRVSISARWGAAASPGAPPDIDTAKPGGSRDRIPARYNEQTTLHAEVKDGGPNAFDFQLSGKPDPSKAKAAGR